MEERAVLIVGGQKFEDWESVWCQKILGDSYHQFKFTCAERDEAPRQLEPEDECSIELAGQLAITGMILTRQAAYDANNHGVMLQGVSHTWAAARASIIHKTNSFDGKTFMQIAEEVLKPTGVKGRKVGQINEEKFERMHTQPGETIFQFLERIAREISVIVTADEKGDFIFIGEDKPDQIGALIEGVNILRCQAIISISGERSAYFVHNASAASDSQNMRKASEQEGKAPGRLKRYSPILIPNEQPTWPEKKAKDRAENEARWTRAQYVQATIVVQGWTNGKGRLWEQGKAVSVKSKMAMLDMDMTIQSVTFTQDDASGTLTTLLCIAPWNVKFVPGSEFGIGGTAGRPPSLGE